MGIDEQTLNEIEQEMVSYLLNVDDMNYAMLCGPLVTGYGYAMISDIPNIVRLEKLNLIDDIISEEDSLGSMGLIDTQHQTEFPKRKFHPLRPATMADELAKDPSYSE